MIIKVLGYVGGVMTTDYMEGPLTVLGTGTENGVEIERSGNAVAIEVDGRRIDLDPRLAAPFDWIDLRYIPLTLND